MKSTVFTTAVIVAYLLAGAPSVDAGQRPRNPGGDSGGSSGGSSGGTSTGSVAVPRDGGSTPWGGGGSVASRPSEPVSRPSGGSRTTRGGGSGGGGPVYGGGGSVPGYSRPRNGAPVTGYGVPRGTVATLPPIISGPIYWGPGDWFFYPWGYGALGLGYFWDPWMWSGMGYGWGGYGYPYSDPYFGGGGGGGGWGGSSYAPADSGQGDPQNPLDPNAPSGGVRLKVEPRDAEVYVDGFYAGRVDDFDGAMQKLKIAQGSHRIELRATGYETASFAVTIIAGETTTYKTSLKRQ